MRLSQGQTAGQTFSTRQAGFSGLDLYIYPRNKGDGSLVFELFPNPQSTALLASASVPLNTLQQADWVRFALNVPAAREAADYYLSVHLEGTGEVGLGSAPGEAYLDGSAYQDGQPLPDQQLAFRIRYDSAAAVLGLAGEAVQWALWLALAALLFVLPGWVLLSFTWPQWQDLFLEERLGLSIGLSLALYPPLLLWTDLMGWHWGRFYAILPPGLAAAALLVRAVRRVRAKQPVFPAVRSLFLTNWGVISAFTLTALIIFGVRFYAVRSLPLPLWGDALQHTLITRLIMDNQGLFQSWQPYAEMTSFTYHFGFHSLTALFGWLAGLTAEQAVIWFGQILNGLAVLAVVPLVLLFTRNRWAGIAGLVIAGLLLPMPMFYVNWGRYTQLAGQSILPFVLYASYTLLRSREKARPAIIVAGLATGGLALAHYRILILMILFLAACLLGSGLAGLKGRLIKTLQIGLIGGGLFLPWFLHLYGGVWLANFGSQLSTPANAVAASLESYNSTGPLTDYMPAWMWLVLALALGWGLWRREAVGAVFASWLALVYLATNPAVLNLPGTGAISNFAIMIAVYIPAGIFGGAAAGWLLEKLPWQRSALLSAVLLALFLGLGLLGGKQRISDVQASRYALATRADLRAAAWVRDHLPQDANFLVNSFAAYGGTVMAGSDGGWWIRYLTGRQSTLPPLLYGTEKSAVPDLALKVNALTTLVREKGIDSAAALAEFKQRGINYVYLGQLQGRAGFGGPYPMEPVNFLSSTHYQPVYHQDRVWIFKINP